MTLHDLLASKSTRDVTTALRCDRITAWRLRKGIRRIGRRELAFAALAWPSEWDVDATLRAIGNELSAELDCTEPSQAEGEA